MGEGWRVAERLLAGVVIGLAVGLVIAWIGLQITGMVLSSHRVVEGGFPRRPAPAVPFPRAGDGRFFPVSLSVSWNPETTPRS